MKRMRSGCRAIAAKLRRRAGSNFLPPAPALLASLRLPPPSRPRVKKPRPSIQPARELLLQQFLDAVLELEHHRYGVDGDPVGLAVEADVQRVEQLGVDRIAFV